VGRLMKKLDELGIAGNTVVIFISDNGGYINEYKNKTVTSNFPLRSGKGSLYEGGIRIPTIIFLPNNPQNGKKIETPVSTIDFYPTLLDITGTVNKIPVDGKSILPLLKGNADTSLQNRTLYWHYPHYYPTTTPVSAIREGKWKLMEYLEDGHTELYNLDADPGETRNLVNEEQKKAGVLLEKLQNWKKRVDARGIVPNPNYRQ
jgi:arylsulfatase A-like enzyme